MMFVSFMGIVLMVLIIWGAPTPTARAAPSGIRLEDGHSTLITFSLDTNVEIWEIEVKPPGLDGGDPINTTTMHNVLFRTMSHRALQTLTECTSTCAFDPIAYDSLRAMINRDQTITITFPDESTLCFYGFLQKFEPTGLKEGEMPTASVSVCPTNKDSGGVEQAPVLSNVAGT